jgi:transcriptional regulator with XRE-family HTH domain
MKADDRPAASVAKGFGENLARCRKRAGISQEELGFRAELHRTEIGILEGGSRLPQLDTLLKLAGGLRVEPSQLLEGLSWSPGGVRPGSFESRDGQAHSRDRE